MITLAVWVLLFAALGIAAHFFGADSRDADYSVRVTPRSAPRTGLRACATQPPRPIG